MYQWRFVRPLVLKICRNHAEMLIYVPSAVHAPKAVHVPLAVGTLLAVGILLAVHVPMAVHGSKTHLHE